jgi:CRISPR-associated protein Csx10
LQAGTVLVFGVDGELPEDLPSRLRAIEASGLGERRGEGFGEVVFDHPLAALGVSTLDTAQSDTRRAAMAPRQITSTSRSHALGRVLESVAWRTAVRQSVVQWAADPRHREPPTGAASLISLGWKRREPTNTQLGALRALALGFPATRGVLATWIQKQLDRKDRWPAESLDVIRQMTTDAGFLWNAVGIDVSDLPAITEGARDSLPRDVWPEAVRALLLSAIRFETRAREASSRAVKGQAVEEAQ